MGGFDHYPLQGTQNAVICSISTIGVQVWVHTSDRFQCLPAEVKSMTQREEP
jgi:hypothetical protein